MCARKRALLLLLALACAHARAAGFELTPEEAGRVQRGEIVILASLDASQRSGTVRAAMQVDAGPHVLYEAMSHCAHALKFVPHLRKCRQSTPPDEPTVSLVEHEVDFGWWAPRLRYVIRAEMVADRSITFRQVSGDFRVNEGMWEFEPMDDGRRTLVKYRAHIDPPAHVPNWLARSTFRKELPLMLQNFRRHCEAGVLAP